jgi:hypothetical protein
MGNLNLGVQQQCWTGMLSKDLPMTERRNIDERDIDSLLAGLTDTQIAAVFGMTEMEVYTLRQSRGSQLSPSRSNQQGPRATKA